VKLLDLFCGAGGCSVGYARAGFDVVGWDSVAQPDYPYQFHQGDAMGVLADRDYLAGFDVIHASPPCPFYSHASNASGTAANHPALIEPVRDALRAWGGAYVIENVEGAGWAMDHPLLVCGWAMGLRHIRRHRLFESNVWLMSPGCLCPRGDSVSVFGDAGEDRRKATIAARGGTMRKRVDLPDAAALMGVEWITSRKAVSNAIPPAYTEYVGAQLVDAL
jgi:DNA (cytosine-5)-methyltransferase 1